jgi:hypothetical protein
MEKTNWIEKIKEAVRVAMNKGLNILIGTENFPYNIEIKNEICIYIYKDRIIINTQHGYTKIEHSLTDREQLEIHALIISIREYKEDMAISEFEEFISDKKEEITDINNLDDDD